MRSFSRVLGVATVAVAMTATSFAFGGDTSTAEHLFQQGLDAMKKNQYKEACDAFAGSNEADPSPGTEMNLALCSEKQGKLATAWGWYRTAAGLAEQRNQKERAELAHKEAATIEPKLHKLVISVKFPADGMTVTRNGAPVPSAVLGTDVPIDPGDYVIEVNAKSKKSWKQTVHIASAPGVDRLEVPALEDGPPEPKVGGPAGGDYKPPTTGNDGSTQRTVGFIVGTVGLVGLVAAGGIQIFNLAVTNQDYKKYADQATAAKCGTPQADPMKDCAGILAGKQSKDDARSTNQTASLVVAVVGGAALITGIVLYVVAPSAKTTGSLSRPLVTPLVGTNNAGIGLSGSF